MLLYSSIHHGCLFVFRSLYNLFYAISILKLKYFFVITEGENTIYLKIVTHLPDPPIVLDHMVPLLMSEYKSIPLESWDLTSQQVL